MQAEPNPQEEQTYLWSDVWLLLAILMAPREGPADLRSILAAGDYLEHAIFRFEEMEGGLFRLTRGGYVEEVAGGFVPTEMAQEMFRRIASQTRRRRALREAVAHAIGVQRPGPSVQAQAAENGHRYPSLTRSRYEEAVRRYLQKENSRDDSSHCE